MSARQAAGLIRSGMTVAMSGFTLTGYPKLVPEALAETGHAQGLTLITGASVGDGLEGVMARAGLVSRRFPYQSNPTMRRLINEGAVAYADMHLSMLPAMLRWGTGCKIDVAVIECAAVLENGLVPTCSVGASDAFVSMADKVIVELNTDVPESIVGMHDIFEIGVPPSARVIPILHPSDRIGLPYIPCPPEKIAAVVLSDRADDRPHFPESSPAAEKIGGHILRFLEDEVEAGRLPPSLGPIQSGVGAVANAVLRSLRAGGFRGLSMYTETCQDAALELLEAGVFSDVSTTAVSLSAEAQKRFYDNLDWFKQRLVLRPQEITNHPEVVRRLGLIAMNTPIEVDLCGNVNSTHVMGGTIMNGIGGSGDFARNARLNIFATESVAKGGSISCIVPMVSHVDHTEHDTQIIVTEQGVADLRWCSPEERAELLIENCAHPDYRPQLRQYLASAKRSGIGRHIPQHPMQAWDWYARVRSGGSMKEPQG